MISSAISPFKEVGRVFSLRSGMPHCRISPKNDFLFVVFSSQETLLFRSRLSISSISFASFSSFNAPRIREKRHFSVVALLLRADVRALRSAQIALAQEVRPFELFVRIFARGWSFNIPVVVTYFLILSSFARYQRLSTLSFEYAT